LDMTHINSKKFSSICQKTIKIRYMFWNKITSYGQN